MEGKYWITHLVPDELPKKGWRKIYFYTTKDINSGKYHFGTGSSVYDEKRINEEVMNGELIPLFEPVELKEGKGLWLTPEGHIYYADLMEPFKDEDKKFLWSPRQLSRVNTIYQKDIINKELPTVQKEISINEDSVAGTA